MVADRLEGRRRCLELLVGFAGGRAQRCLITERWLVCGDI